MTQCPPYKSDTPPWNRPWVLSLKSLGDAPCSLLTFMGDTVHRPLICGVKGGEGATG